MVLIDFLPLVSHSLVFSDKLGPFPLGLFKIRPEPLELVLREDLARLDLIVSPRLEVVHNLAEVADLRGHRIVARLELPHKLLKVGPVFVGGVPGVTDA